MRVISGSARATTLYAVKGIQTRPTSDFIKENLFNIIRDDLRDAAFLDLFAGTGAIGIEALSRGVKQVVFVDISRKCVEVIGRNLDKTRLADRAVVIKDDALKAIKKLADRNNVFDIIYMDPPYFEDLLLNVMEYVVAHRILAKDGYIVVEMSKQYNAPEVHGLNIFKAKEYSGTRLVFYERTYNSEFTEETK